MFKLQLMPSRAPNLNRWRLHEFSIKLGSGLILCHARDQEQYLKLKSFPCMPPIMTKLKWNRRSPTKKEHEITKRGTFRIWGRIQDTRGCLLLQQCTLYSWQFPEYILSVLTIKYESAWDNGYGYASYLNLAIPKYIFQNQCILYRTYIILSISNQVVFAMKSCQIFKNLKNKNLKFNKTIRKYS